MRLVPRIVDNHIAGVVMESVSPRRVAMEQVFSFVNYNRVEGDYLEFGCCGANTFCYAHDAMKARGLNRHMYAFDSFAGLPAGQGVDDHPDFPKGKFSQSQEKFESVLRAHGISAQRYTIVSGFYEDVLTEGLMSVLPIRRAAVVYIDSDLYRSAKSALNFVVGWLQTGTIICFDDYFCFDGDPDRGESLAKKEFLREHPNITMRPYFGYGWAGKAFICKVKQDNE